MKKAVRRSESNRSSTLESPRRWPRLTSLAVFYRILFFYICGITIVGMLVPSDDPRLLQSKGTAASSPFVLAFNRAGISVLPSIINAGVLTSGTSHASSCQPPHFAACIALRSPQ